MLDWRPDLWIFTGRKALYAAHSVVGGRRSVKLWSHYHVAQSAGEAIALLIHYQGQAQIVAGGTDLLLDIQQGNHPPAEALIDITRVPELLEIASEAVDGGECLI